MSDSVDNPQLSYTSKRFLLMFADALVLAMSLWFAVALRYGDAYVDMTLFWWHFPIVAAAGVLALEKFGLYKAVIRYIGPSSILPVIKGITVAAIVVSCASYITGTSSLPRSAPIIFWFIAIFLVGAGRIFVRIYFYGLFNSYLMREPVAIFGADDSGVELAIALLNGDQYVPVAFLDGKKELSKKTIHGIRVYSPERLDSLIDQYGIKRVLLSLAEIDEKHRHSILNGLSSSPVQISVVPRIQSLVDGSEEPEIREIDISDLLGREVVSPDEALLSSAIYGKNILITGAAGTIGAAIVRKILLRKPASLLLFDKDEYGLYALEQEVSNRNGAASSIEVPDKPTHTKIIPVLGTITNTAHLLDLLCEFSIDTVYHAAAYKHVPLVEMNILEGVRNNVLGTLSVAKAVAESHTKELVFISSDKAVRPTNVMGASKRLAELIVQGFSRRNGLEDKRYCIVRFGNVLKSSGSVIPLFEKQIKKGGPVTVTDPDASRYFMTSEEASELVIQAGAMSEGGEIFVLKMGEPVKIRDIAEKMIHLNGKIVGDSSSSGRNENDAIEIVYIGLRPGEKLSEELFIGESLIDSSHPKIMIANDGCLSWDVLQDLCLKLETACRESDYPLMRGTLEYFVDGYTMLVDPVDPVFLKSWKSAH